MSVVIIILIFVTLVAHYYFRYFQTVRYYGKLKGPFPVPFLGDVLRFNSVERILPYFYESMKKYGTVFRIFNGYMPYIIVADCDLANKIMSSSAMNTKDYIYKFFHDWLGTGLLTSTGKKWATHRKLITPTFHFKILKSFAETFETVGTILIEKLNEVEEDKSFDVFPFINLYALDTICETALGTKINAQTDYNNAYVCAVKQLLNIIVERMMNPLKQVKAMYMCFPSYWKEAKLIKAVHNHTKSIITNRKKLHVEGKIDMEMENVFGSKIKIAFLDMLIKGNVEGLPLTDEEIREEVDTFMFAGHDTVTTALSYILYLISTHPEVQDKLYQELVGIFHDDKKRHATFEELQEIPYLEMVIKESMRLYPPAPAFSRYVIEDLDFGMMKIKANTGVFITPYLIHRFPEYFPEPEKFIPERFSIESIHKIKPYTYIPFSAGFRNCIGQKYAMLKMKSAMSKIVRNFELLPDPTFEPILTFEVLLKSANSIKIKLRRRK